MSWKPHTSSAVPCNEGCTVKVRYASGHESKHEYRAGRLNWRKRGEPFDIAEYLVTAGPEEA